MKSIILENCSLKETLRQKAENHVCFAFLFVVKNSFAQLNSAKKELELIEVIAVFRIAEFPLKFRRWFSLLNY